MRGIKIPLQDFALKMQGRGGGGGGGGAYARGGAYLWDTTVIVTSQLLLTRKLRANSQLHS